MSSKGIQLDTKENLFYLPSNPSRVSLSSTKVRFFEDSKRKTSALPNLECEGHLWLDGYALYILTMTEENETSLIT